MNQKNLDVVAFIYQVSGHGSKEPGKGLLKSSTNVLKPQQNSHLNDKRSFRERALYVDAPSWLKQLLPRYGGETAIGDKKYIILEDITHSFIKPCIIDLKLGTQLHPPDSDIEKIKRMKAKVLATTSSLIGLRISGIKKYCSKNNNYITKDKYYGRSIKDRNEFTVSLCDFFTDTSQNLLRKDVLLPLIDRITTFINILSVQKDYMLYATSLLIVYEGDLDQSKNKKNPLIDMRLIDFANAVPVSQKDKDILENECVHEDIVTGLENLLNIIKSI